jgi:hypothetical protein
MAPFFTLTEVIALLPIWELPTLFFGSLKAA